MRAPVVVFPEPHRVAVEEREVRDPGPGQVLARTSASVISPGTELTVLAHTGWATRVRFPFLPGYSMAGEVVAVGPGVTDVQVGDHICGGGHHAAYETLSVAGINKLPPGVTDEDACFRTMAQITLNGVRLSQLVFGEAVAVVGLGLVGQLAAQWARFAGALPLIGVDLARERLDLAGRIGPIVPVQPGVDDPVAALRQATRGRMADVVIEATGEPNVLPDAAKLARSLGRVVLLGSSRGVTTIDMHEDVHQRGLHLIGAHNNTHPPVATPYNPWTRERDGELFLDLLAAGHANVRDLITHRYPAPEAPEAYALLTGPERSQALAIILQWV